MAQLTWRNIDAPDFTPAMQGYQQFSQLFGGAINGIQSSLNRADNSISDRVNSEIMAKVALARDADAARNVASTALVDPNIVRRISPGTLTALQARPGQVIAEQASENSFERTLKNNALTDQLRPIFAKVSMLNKENTPESRSKAEQIITESMPLISQADADTQTALFKNSFSWEKEQLGLESERLGLANQTLNSKENQWDYDQKLADFGRNEQAQNIVATIRQNGGITDGASAIAALNAMGITDGKLYNTITAGLTAAYGGTSNEYAISRIDDGSDYGAGGSSGGGGSGGANRAYRKGSPYNTVLGDGEYGLPSKPVSEMTMGEAYDFGRNTLTPATIKAKVGRLPNGDLVGSTALGAYQFVGSTMMNLAKKMYGDNWRSMPFDAKTQEALAERLFNDNKGGNLQKTWEGLPNRTRGAYANKTWAEMRLIINKFEVGNSGGGGGKTASNAPFTRVSAGEIAGLKTSFTKSEGANPNNMALSRYGELTGIDSSPTKEAQRLFKDDNSISVAKYEAAVRGAVAKYKVTPAVAGRMVDFSRKADSTWDILGGKGRYVDAKLLDQQGSLFQGQGMKAIELSGIRSNSAQALASVEAALAQNNEAKDRLAKARLAKQNKPSLDISTVVLDEERAARVLREATNAAAVQASKVNNGKDKPAPKAAPKPTVNWAGAGKKETHAEFKKRTAGSSFWDIFGK